MVHHWRARTYLGVYSALMVATLVTVAVGLLHLEVPVALVVALVIALGKASLVGLYFMHLRWERSAVYASLALALFLLASLVGLMVASAADQVGIVL